MKKNRIIRTSENSYRLFFNGLPKAKQYIIKQYCESGELISTDFIAGTNKYLEYRITDFTPRVMIDIIYNENERELYRYKTNIAGKGIDGTSRAFDVLREAGNKLTKAVAARGAK